MRKLYRALILAGRKPWAVDYDLIYDNGSYQWTTRYRTKATALLCLCWHRGIASWGGKTTLRRIDHATQ